VQVYRSGVNEEFDPILSELAGICAGFFASLASSQVQLPYATAVNLMVSASIILAALNPRETSVIIPSAAAAVPIYQAAHIVFPPGDAVPVEVGHFLTTLLLKLEYNGSDMTPLGAELESWKITANGDDAL
jgi:hypothetical protein